MPHAAPIMLGYAYAKRKMSARNLFRVCIAQLVGGRVFTLRSRCQKQDVSFITKPERLNCSTCQPRLVLSRYVSSMRSLAPDSMQLFWDCFSFNTQALLEMLFAQGPFTFLSPRVAQNNSDV